MSSPEKMLTLSNIEGWINYKLKRYYSMPTIEVVRLGIKEHKKLGCELYYVDIKYKGLVKTVHADAAFLNASESPALYLVAECMPFARGLIRFKEQKEQEEHDV
ncbi:MAG: hypothetical protein KAR06_08025 [Deltaproteobacteria bacterium]|nr:hypothetical protein [Deltaproteobacteria bacterium]